MTRIALSFRQDFSRCRPLRCHSTTSKSHKFALHTRASSFAYFLLIKSKYCSSYYDHRERCAAITFRPIVLLEWLTPHYLEQVQMSLKTQIVSQFVICTLNRRTYHLQNRLHLLRSRIPGIFEIKDPTCYLSVMCTHDVRTYHLQTLHQSKCI